MIRTVDFPFWMRVVVVILVLSTLGASIIFTVGILSIVSLLSATGAHPAAWGIVGAILGAIISAGVGTWTARELYRRQHAKEAADLAVSFHAELADRAARCVSDYLVPWKGIANTAGRTKKVTASWVVKFRPVDPVVYPGLAPKLGLLPPDAIFSVLQFYFRLDALQREIDRISAEFAPDQELHRTHPARLVVVTRRFQSCIHPALLALEKLNVPSWEAIEREAADTYPHLRETGKSLRQVLKEEEIKTR